MAGMHKHKWSYTVKYAPDHFGRNKFQPPNRTVTKRWVNVADLERLAGDSSRLDLSSLGYDKLLGSGEVHRSLVVKVSRASSSAVEKIKTAGGSVETEPQTTVKKTSDEKEIGKSSPPSKSESKKDKAKVS